MSTVQAENSCCVEKTRLYTNTPASFQYGRETFSVTVADHHNDEDEDEEDDEANNDEW